MESLVLREIKPEDNPQIEAIIKNCFVEFKMPMKGTAYEDAETPFMYESYQNEREIYFVVANENTHEVLGGGGIKPLKGFDGNVCELQKMYFSSKLRGKGFAPLMIKKCLEFAEQAGYQKVYLETFLTLEKAIQLYKNFGFKELESSLGNTGHCACDIWMIKKLKS